MNTIGENIKKYRKLAKMTQEELAEKIGANRVTIARYENGNYLPSVPAIHALADALGVTESILSGIDEPPPKVEPEIPEVAIMARAMEKMTPQQRNMMVDLGKAAFKELFNDGE